MRFEGEGAQSLHDWLRAEPAPTSDLAAWAGDLRRLDFGSGLIPNEFLAPAFADAADPFYVSADTAPAGFAVRRSLWVAPLFLACFAAASAGVALVADTLARAYANVLGMLTGVDPGSLAAAGSSISIRPFALIFFVLLAAFAVGPLRRRGRFLLAAGSVYATLAVLADANLVFARPIGAPDPLSPMGGLVAVAVAFFTAVYIVFTQYELPSGVRVATERKRPWSYALVFLAILAIAACAAAVTRIYRDHLDESTLKSLVALASTSVVLVVGLQLLLFLIAARRRRPIPAEGFSPSVAFLIPAHNEEESVAATIQAIDEVACRYDGECRLYLVDNASVDRTGERATQALSECKALLGRVLSCPTRGKAYALNYGLAHTTEEIVVRVDSDTIVQPSLLNDVAPYFSDETVGGVSGIPLPRSDAPRWLYPIWLMEVYHTIGFIRVAQNAIDGALVLPGSMSVYRGDLVRKLGGFAVGHNGEDGDMAVRIGRLGYRLVTDPRIEFFTEVPATLGHLMEQRLRWYRGGFYKTARNKSSFVLRQGLRGLLVLPWAALTACRRSLTLPILVGVAAASALDPSIFTLREVAVVGGTAIGANLLIVGLILLAKRRPAALPFVPAYVLFRLFKLYVAFAALLTLELRRSTLASRRRREVAQEALECQVPSFGDFQSRRSSSASRPRACAIEIRSCASESRSRIVTVSSSSVCSSTVNANGVPISSWRR